MIFVHNKKESEVEVKFIIKSEQRVGKEALRPALVQLLYVYGTHRPTFYFYKLQAYRCRLDEHVSHTRNNERQFMTSDYDHYGIRLSRSK